MFNKIILSDLYEIRDEGNRVLFFSGTTRHIHYISKEAFMILKLANENSFNEISKDTSTENKNKLTTFFNTLRDYGVIEYQ